MFGSKEAILTPKCAGGLLGMEVLGRSRLIVMMLLLEGLVGNQMNVSEALPRVIQRHLGLLLQYGLRGQAVLWNCPLVGMVNGI